LTKLIEYELKKRFPQVHTTDGVIVEFEGPRFPNLRIWNLSDPISTGKIEIKQSQKLSLVSYEIDMSKYVVGKIAIFILVLIFMFFFDFPIMLILVFTILVVFFSLLVPCLTIMNFSSFVRKAIGTTGGRILGRV
jgi:hypothetical protein